MPNERSIFLAPEDEQAYALLRAVITQRPLALIFDVDGTLAPIAPTPSLAVVPESTSALLKLLCARGAICGAVSGRSAHDAHRLVGVDEMVYIGNHGIDQVIDGKYSVLPRAAAHTPRIEQALLDLQQEIDLPGIIFEPKGPTASIHYRLADDSEAARARILAALERWQHELRITEGKFVVEIRPPVTATKGDGVVHIVRTHGCRGVLYIGDDRTDVDAFNAVARLRTEGVTGVSLVVCDAETADEVRSAADIQVAGIAGVQALLAWLAEVILPAPTTRPLNS